MSHSSLIACPACQTPNRVPYARMVDSPVCGRCRERLFQGRALELNTSAFQKLVRNTDIPIVVDFWASWCGPCKMMSPIFEQIARAMEPEMRFVKVNTETEQTLAGQYGIRSIPTLLVLDNGREVARQSGAMDAASLKRWLESVV